VRGAQKADSDCDEWLWRCLAGLCAAIGCLQGSQSPSSLRIPATVHCYACNVLQQQLRDAPAAPYPSGNRALGTRRAHSAVHSAATVASQRQATTRRWAATVFVGGPSSRKHGTASRRCRSPAARDLSSGTHCSHLICCLDALFVLLRVVQLGHLLEEPLLLRRQRLAPLLAAHARALPSATYTLLQHMPAHVLCYRLSQAG
jgi:hypothetical protein